MPPATTAVKMEFPSITECDVESVSRRSIAADLDGTLLISRSALTCYMLVAIEAGSLLRGFVLLLCFPLIAAVYFFISERLACQALIFVTFAGLKIRDIELASRAVLLRFYTADVRRESYEVFERCDRKVVVTANPTVMVEPFVREYLGGDKVLGTEIEVNPKTNRATGFVKRPGVLIGKWKRMAVLEEFGDELPDIGIGDRESDHDFMSLCKEGYMVRGDKSASPVPLDRLKSRLSCHDERPVQLPTPLNAVATFLRQAFGFLLSLLRLYLHLPLPERVFRYVFPVLRIILKKLVRLMVN